MLFLPARPFKKRNACLLNCIFRKLSDKIPHTVRNQVKSLALKRQILLEDNMPASGRAALLIAFGPNPMVYQYKRK
ncbi:MAG: hypothetical protein A3J51_01200 [Omnitrophica WOR_2 bacterium RIFCSPHIGHO2_02_FULL_45_21]|nr:MAG: hypothetical protein A3J51_01200 [Omnitrophica WOR_2 bacterium RIFCSPHIGHO2_02_FULL_45_21]